MIIRELAATFGALKDKHLTLAPGLNIVVGENECGKSTLCGFLRAMLYGIDTSERDKKGVISEKNRYRPWSGDSMCGVLVLEHEGTTVTVERRGTAQSPMREVTVRGLAQTSDISETLLGISRGVFENSAFVGAPPISATAHELEKHINAAVVGGEAESYTAAVARLGEMRNRLYSNRANGLIPKLEAELEALQSELATLEKLEQRQSEAAAAIEPLEAKIQELRAELERHEAYNPQRAAVALAKQRLDNAQLAVCAARDELPDGVEQSAALVELQAEAWQELERRASADSQPKKQSKRPFLIPLLLAALLGVAALYVLLPPPLKPYSFFAMLLSVPALIARPRAATQTPPPPSSDISERLFNLLGTRDLNEAIAALGAAIIAAHHYEAALRERDAAQALYSSLKDASNGDAMDSLTSDRAAVQDALYGCEQELMSLRQTLHRAEGAIGSRDSAALRQSAETARMRLAVLRRHRDATDMARTLLDAADRRLAERFSPALAMETAKILSRLTDGRYTRTAISRDFSPEAGGSGAEGLRSILQLSSGTADQLWLAVRLAVVRLTLSPSVPLILDDSLVSFDDKRALAALELLSEEARTRQVILFTCHSRDAAMAKGANVVQL